MRLNAPVSASSTMTDGCRIRRRQSLIGLLIDDNVGGLLKILRVRVSAALIAVTDLLDELPVGREFECMSSDGRSTQLRFGLFQPIQTRSL